jgi:LytS/YehU family sensor histidine kinase
MAGFAIVPGLIGFYAFYSVLFRRFLSRRKIGALVAAGLAVSIAASLIGGATVALALEPKVVYGGDLAGFIFVTITISFGALINGIIGLVMRGFITSYADIKLKEELNRKNYQMELELLKAQINPHFLFNTINNIDVLITKEPERASAYLNKLSDIMRFMLYETKTEEIPLEKELNYIGKYIDLQKIRTSTANYVNYEVQGNPAEWTVAPMLFIPFIENAFKYAENRKMENAVSIKLSVAKDKLTFDCVNSYIAQAQVKPGQSGLGNELIRKRLMLLYPQRHSLNITDENETYRVNLTLDRNAH